MSSGHATAGAGGTGSTAGAAGSAGAGGTGQPPSSLDAGNPTDARASADTGAGDVDAGTAPWWERAVFTPVAWTPGECAISVADDPAAIETLQWQPLTLGGLVGETPVVPLGHYYSELADGTSWTGGRLASGEFVVAVRDPSGEPVLGFKYTDCQFQLAGTGRGLCALFVRVPGEPAVLSCGDLLAPDPLIELDEGGFIVASSEDLVLVRGGFGHDVHVVDLSDGSVTVTTVAGDSFGEAAAHGRDAFVVYESSEPVAWRGILFRWDGAAGYEQLRDPLPLAVVNVQADANDLVWTRTGRSRRRTRARASTAQHCRCRRDRSLRCSSARSNRTRAATGRPWGRDISQPRPSSRSS